MDKVNPNRATEAAIGADPAIVARETLAAERLRALALGEALQTDFDLGVESAASSNADDEHDPEGATLAFERAQVVFMQAQCRSRLEDIDRAIERCEQGGYGVCEGCGEMIPGERLAARPMARTCLSCVL